MKKLNQFAQWLGLDAFWQLVVFPPIAWALFYYAWALVAALEAAPV